MIWGMLWVLHSTQIYWPERHQHSYWNCNKSQGQGSCSNKNVCNASGMKYNCLFIYWQSQKHEEPLHPGVESKLSLKQCFGFFFTVWLIDHLYKIVINVSGGSFHFYQMLYVMNTSVWSSYLLIEMDVFELFVQ